MKTAVLDALVPAELPLLSTGAAEPSAFEGAATVGCAGAMLGQVEQASAKAMEARSLMG